MRCSPTSTYGPSLRRSAITLLAHLRRILNGWVAAAIAHRNARRLLFALRQPDDRELNDMGIAKAPRLRLRRRRFDQT